MEFLELLLAEDCLRNSRFDMQLKQTSPIYWWIFAYCPAITRRIAEPIVGSKNRNSKLEGRQIFILNINGTHPREELENIFSSSRIIEIALSKVTQCGFFFSVKSSHTILQVPVKKFAMRCCCKNLNYLVITYETRSNNPLQSWDPILHCKKGYRFSRSQPGCHLSNFNFFPLGRV